MHLIFAFLAALVGETYGVVVGGGGILIQFTLAAIGLPLISVVATDIAGSQGADIGVVLASSKKGWRNSKLLLTLATPYFIGGVVGTLLLIHISLTLLKIVLVVGLSLLLLHKLIGKEKETQAFENIRLSPKQYPVIFVSMFLLGVYGNISGVGVGAFARFVYTSLLRISFVESLGLGSLIFLPAGIFAIVVTGADGLIRWPYFFMILIGSFIGGNFIARHIRKVPEKYLKTLLIVVVIIYLTYLITSLV